MFNTLKFILSHPLNRSHRLAAMKRFLGWQFKSRLVGQPLVYPFIENARFIVRKGVTGLTGNIYCGLHEFEEMAFVLHYLREKDAFADIGANVGSYSILAGKICGATVTCFEPIPHTYQYLIDNLALNHIPADARNQGVGAAPGQLKFITHQDTMNRIALANEEGIVVDVVRLDDVFQSHIPALIKVDVEGYEAEVLKGAERILAQPDLNAIIIEVNGSSDKFGAGNDAIHAKLSSSGFKPFLYNPFKRHLEPLSSWKDGNTIYIKNVEEATSRLKKAKPIHINSVIV